MTRFSLLRNAARGTNSPRPIVRRNETNGCQTYADCVSYKVAPIKRTYARIHGGAAPPPHRPLPAHSNVPVFSFADDNLSAGRGIVYGFIGGLVLWAVVLTVILA